MDASSGGGRQAVHTHTWEFDLPAQPGRLSPALRDHTLAVHGILDGFAEPTAVTFTPGDETAVLAGDVIDMEAIAAAFRRLPEPHRVDLALECAVTAADGTEDSICDGASVTLELRNDRIHLTLGLDTDVYAARTNGKIPRNEVLAGLNAPRLSSFLARLTATVGARFVRLSTHPFYAHQVSEHGFFESIGPGRRADLAQALKTGRRMSLSNLPEDPRQYILMEEQVVIDKESPHRYRFTTTVTFHDGSTTSSGPTEEFHDLPAALTQIDTLRERGYSLELR